MDSNTIEDVVHKLIGAIGPVGETRTDESRLDNLKVLTSVADGLLYEINSVAKHADRNEASMSAAGIFAKKFLEHVVNEYSTHTAERRIMKTINQREKP